MLPEHREAAEALLDAHRNAQARHDANAAEMRTAEHHVITACRAAGMPWSDIAQALGLPSADAARIRHHRWA